MSTLNQVGGSVVVTGAAGFIGFSVADALLRRGIPVMGLDSLNSYYSPFLKHSRLEVLKRYPLFEFRRVDISDPSAVDNAFASWHGDTLVHLAAQAGVQYSIENPLAYSQSNLSGFLNIAEICRRKGLTRLVYASSSSVYGDSSSVPFTVSHRVDSPVSLYAATKIANESIAHAYSHLYGFQSIGLRFFTVYGPWGRPDMAYWKFTEAILSNRPIELFYEGRARRDFTYIDDIVAAVCRITLDERASSFQERSGAASLYNIGNHTPIDLLTFVQTLESAIGKKAKIVFRQARPGDVFETYADISELQRDFGFAPDTRLEYGLGRFVDWYRSQWQPIVGTAHGGSRDD